jgi:hypothetical protein
LAKPCPAGTLTLQETPGFAWRTRNEFSESLYSFDFGVDTPADNISSISATLQNASSLTGAVNSANTALSVTLTHDESSIWTVTADSSLAILSDSAGISGETITNIIGNGFFVYYDASRSENSALAGKTYSLNGGGYLTPKTIAGN